MPVRIDGTDLIYFPVPKIACTSIKSAILQHNDPDLHASIQKREKKGRHIHHVYPSKKFRAWRGLLHAPKGDWFCVVRDPIRRAVSGYRNRILYHRDLKRVAPDVLERNGLTIEPDLNSFAMNLATYARVSKAVHHHFSPHHFYLGSRPERFAHVFSLSAIGDMTKLVADAGVALDIPHEQTGGPKVSVDDLSPEAMTALKDFYAEDYRIWGTHFD